MTDELEPEQILWRHGKRNEAKQTAVAIRELVASLSVVARWGDESTIRQTLMQIGSAETSYEGGGLSPDSKPGFSIHLSPPMHNFLVMCFAGSEDKVFLSIHGMSQYSGFELKCELPAASMVVDINANAAEGVTEDAIFLARAMHKLPHGQSLIP